MGLPSLGRSMPSFGRASAVATAQACRPAEGQTRSTRKQKWEGVAAGRTQAEGAASADGVAAGSS